eukprot:scaffold544835_cov55-Prasinocladus_malaysianus.AAC.2
MNYKRRRNPSRVLTAYYYITMYRSFHWAGYAQTNSRSSRYVPQCQARVLVATTNNLNATDV